MCVCSKSRPNLREGREQIEITNGKKKKKTKIILH